MRLACFWAKTETTQLFNDPPPLLVWYFALMICKNSKLLRNRNYFWRKV